jgi:phage repressor protein C with HTH and peptisase S24 domain
MSISERIKLVFEREGITNIVAAGWLGITASRMSQKMNDAIWDSVRELTLVSEMTGYNLEWLVYGTGAEKLQETFESKENQEQYLAGKVIRPITVTVDRSGKELISYVPVKAQAGYMRGYGDAKFIEKLPAFTLPQFNDHGSFRMFQVSGDSMLQLGGGGLHDGDIVIGQYLEDIFSLRDNRVYVIVSTEGVVVKRVLNRLTTADKALILKSDNKNGQHQDRVLHAKDILEVWELKAFISRQLSFATDLWELINDLQANQALLAERVDNMDSATRALLNSPNAKK